MVASALLSGRGRPITTSSASRSVRTLATASSSGTRPFMGTSALAVVMMRPRTRATSGTGRKRRVSTPTGTTLRRSGSTPICATTSAADDDDTVMTRGSRAATCFCMPRKPYQRRRLSRRRRVRA